jgi:restriction system protein
MVPGGKTDEGLIIRAITPAWNEIIIQTGRDPEFLFKIPPRKLEEMIAAAYERDGWDEVVLTPRSGDDGRDVIATKSGFGSVRFVDQVKAYSPHRLITADDVRSMLGVLACDQNVSKGIVSTTSDFAPGIRKHPKINAFIPHRLELRNAEHLQGWFDRLRSP